MPDKLEGASDAERDLVSHVAAHAQQEKSAVEEYARLIEAEGSDAFVYLARMLLDDEEHHHRIMSDLAESVQAMVESRYQEERVPPLERLLGDRRAVLDATERFLTIERQDAEELKDLEHRLAVYKDTTLWTLLIQFMQDDTAKHIRMLEFIKEHLIHPPT